MASSVIELSGISKRYRGTPRLFQRRSCKNIQALNDVTFMVPEEVVCCVLGLNGAGKTTLLKILATLIAPDKGEAFLCGLNLVEKPGEIRAHIGLINDNERSFYWRLSLRQNLEFFAALYKIFGNTRKKRINEALRLVGIEDIADKRFDACSAGQKQRLSIARAMLSDPQILLMDEPTSNLDVVAAAELRLLIRDQLVAERGKTVLWCTHNLIEAQEIGDQILMLHQGKVVADLSLTELSKMLAKKTYRLEVEKFNMRGFGNNENSSITVKQVQGARWSGGSGKQFWDVTCDEDTIPLILKDLTGRGGVIYSCTQQQPDLELFFNKMIEEHNG